MSSPKRVLVYGGMGALGRQVVDTFKANKWWVLSLDMRANEAADANAVVTPSDSLVAQCTQVEEVVAKALGGNKLDAVLCVAGGFAMGNAASADMIASMDSLIKMSVWTSAIAARLTSLHGVDDVLLQLTGAKAGLGATAGLLGYGATKAAVHQMVASLAHKDGGLPANANCVAILPITLDTPANRGAMPGADMSTWTTLPFIAVLLYSWSSTPSARQPNGSLVQLHTIGGETKLVL